MQFCKKKVKTGVDTMRGCDNVWIWKTAWGRCRKGDKIMTTELKTLRDRLFAIAPSPNHPQRRAWRNAMRQAANVREDAAVHLGAGNVRKDAGHDMEALRAIVARAEAV